MLDRVYGNEFRTTLVCVDSSANGDLSGRLYNPYLDSGVQFHGVLDFLEQMEDLLDNMGQPQAFTAKRSFSPPMAARKPVAAAEQRRGKVATFGLRVLFRQNASWQGTVTWMETEREDAFRSVLELLLMVSSTLPKGGEKAE
jgi:hypothetical protein